MPIYIQRRRLFFYFKMYFSARVIAPVDFAAHIGNQQTPVFVLSFAQRNVCFHTSFKAYEVQHCPADVHSWYITKEIRIALWYVTAFSFSLWLILLGRVSQQSSRLGEIRLLQTIYVCRPPRFTSVTKAVDLHIYLLERWT